MFVELLKEYLGNAAGKRIDVAEADAQHLIQHGVARAVSDDLMTPAVSKAIEGAFSKFTQGLDGVIQEALKQFANAQTLANRHSVPAIFGQGSDGDPKKSFGDWLLAVARQDKHYLEKHFGSTFVNWQTKAALAESSGLAGGYTVPPQFYEQLQLVMAENTFFRPNAYVIPMASATLQIPYLDVTTQQSAGVSPFFGGVQMYWTAEAQNRTETEPQFKQMELRAWELSGYSVSSNVLLQDSAIGLEKFLFQLFAQAIAWYEEYAFLQGNGVGKPLGVLNANATIASGGNGAGTGRQTASQISFADISTMWSKLMPASWNKAFWVGSPSTIPQLLQLKDGANRAIFLAIGATDAGGITKKPNWALLGRPFIPTEKLPALGTKGDLMLIDPSLYVIGDRMQIEIAASEHVNFLKNQMTWRVVERVDGQPWLSAPITLQDSATQVSPFVALN
jgi:HK97 family phage major capsid protein